MSVLGADRPLDGFPRPHTADHIHYNPTTTELRALSASRESSTEFGAPAHVSDHKSRNADRTKNAIDHRFDPEDWSTIKHAIEFLHDRKKELVCVDRQLGRHPTATFHCRLFVPKRHARIAVAWMNLLDPVSSDEPDFITVQLPDYDEPRIRILPESGITCVLGSDYTGEAKKSFLRLFMYRVKQRGGLGLHAGSKRLRVHRDDDLTDVGQLFLGLSATGKTTLTCHDFGVSPPESAAMLQDDVCALLPNGTVAGSEGRGLYIKTIGLSAAEQASLHRAACQPEAVLENVDVGTDGTVDFSSDKHTANTRAVVRREHVDHAAETIDLDRVDQVFFITRNPLTPPIAKLNAEQATVAYMLGESIETSAGNPDKVGEAVRVVGTNPFIIGDRGEEGNRFYDLIRALEVDCFMLNTGQIGANGREIRVADTVAMVTAVARQTIEWRDDRRLRLTIPRAVPGTTFETFDPASQIENFDRKLDRLRRDRWVYLRQFDNLRDPIKAAVY